MRVIVTGASGNVGTSVLAALADDPAVSEIVGVARRVPSASFSKTTWRAADVSEDDLLPIFAGADVVLHLAWLIQPSRDERATRRANVDGSARVFDAVARAEVPALVHASSVGAYAPAPIEGHTVDESWPTTGIATSYYSRQKADVERLLDRFEAEHPNVRTVRLRPALIFKGDAGAEIRRLFAGPLLPSSMIDPRRIPVLPYPRGLRTQAVHARDVGEAYRLACTRDVSGAFNIAADPVLDARGLARALDARLLEIPARLVRVAAWASWTLHLQPSSPGWLDMGMLTPIMDASRARTELDWRPHTTSVEAVIDLLRGISEDAGLHTPPLDPKTGGRFRWREFASGIGSRDRP